VSAFLLIAAFLLGTCLGSFFNVLIYRLPREESILHPGSRCPACGRPVRAWENLPIVSFFLLRGKCAGCGSGISWRYPVVEAMSGVGFLLIAYADGPGFPLLRDLLFFSLLVPIVFIDIDHRIIPDELSLGGLAAGILLSFLPGGDWKGALSGALLGGGILFVTAAVYHRVTGIEGLGGGDVKLLAMIGAFLGWRGALFTILFGSLMGVVGGVVAMRKGNDGLKTAIPYGPYLCAAALIARFLGDFVWGFL
jgi:leader peptidase (prepilin peptidase)/N-methyltransferase